MNLETLTRGIIAVPGVQVVTLFGSRARERGSDEYSDIDLQIITRRPGVFKNNCWLSSSGFPAQVYAWRAAFGGVVKATALLPTSAELDVVVLPWGRLFLARLCVGLRLHRASPFALRALGDLAVVLRPGYRVLHGNSAWTAFFETVVREVLDPRLTNADIARLADSAFLDHVSLQNKARRGELIAAQRWLQLHLVETNLKLWHELQHRRGQVAFHDGRRVEAVAGAQDLLSLAAFPRRTIEDVVLVSDQILNSIKRLRVALLGAPPSWPERP